MFWTPAPKFVCETLGVERVLFAVDYPYESSKVASEFIDRSRLSENDKEKICRLNAEKLLGLQGSLGLRLIV